MAARRSVIALTLLGFLGAACQPLAQKSERSAAELMDAVMWNREPIGGPFALTDQDGTRRTDADFRGKCCWSISGSPIARTSARPTCRRWHSRWINWARPARSCSRSSSRSIPSATPPSTSSSIWPLFHPRFVGLTGDALRSSGGARLPVYYKKVEREKSDYTVDHSAFIYLMGRHGEYLGFFPPGTSAEILAGTLKPLVAGR